MEDDARLFESDVLDFAYTEDTAEMAYAHLAKRFGVHVHVMKENGPGGGWPMVTVIGEVEDVARCIRECWVSGDRNQDDETLALALAGGSYLS